MDEQGEQKLFGLSVAKNYREIVLRGGRYYLRQDLGALFPIWREDEISEAEAREASNGEIGLNRVCGRVKERLLFDASVPNWHPPAGPLS